MTMHVIKTQISMSQPLYSQHSTPSRRFQWLKELSEVHTQCHNHISIDIEASQLVHEIGNKMKWRIKQQIIIN